MLRVRTLLVLCGLLATSSVASAHNLKLMAYLEADHVRVVGRFVDVAKTPADDSQVTVRDAAGAAIATGTTDKDGVWSFPRPKPGVYTIRMECVGHVEQIELPIENDSILGQFQSLEPNTWLGLGIGLAILLVLVLFFRWKARKRGKA